MREDIIKQVNAECPYNHGIFTEPYGIPTHIKEPVIYSRYTMSGYSGGNCWGDKPQYFENNPPKERMCALDTYLKKVKPTITFLQYKEIDKMIEDNVKSCDGYYGNSEDEMIEYIILSELDEYLQSI